MEFQLVPQVYDTATESHEINVINKSMCQQLCQQVYEEIIQPTEHPNNICKRHRYENVDISERVVPLIHKGIKANMNVCTICGIIKQVEINRLDCNYGIGLSAYTNKHVRINFENLCHRSLVWYEGGFGCFKLSITDNDELVITITMRCLCELCDKHFYCLNHPFIIDISNLSNEERNIVKEDVENYVYEMLSKQTTPMRGVLDLTWSTENYENVEIIHAHKVLYEMLCKTLIGKKVLNDEKIIVKTGLSSWERCDRIASAKIENV